MACFDEAVFIYVVFFYCIGNYDVKWVVEVDCLIKYIAISLVSVTGLD